MSISARDAWIQSQIAQGGNPITVFNQANLMFPEAAENVHVAASQPGYVPLSHSLPRGARLDLADVFVPGSVPEAERPALQEESRRAKEAMEKERAEMQEAYKDYVPSDADLRARGLKKNKHGEWEKNRHGIPKFFKKAAPYAAGAAGLFVPGLGMLAGPALGAAVGASQRGKGNKMAGAASGALKGAAIPMAAHALSGGLGGLGGLARDVLGGALGGAFGGGRGEAAGPQAEHEDIPSGGGYGGGQAGLQSLAPQTPESEGEPDILALIQAGLNPLEIIRLLSPKQKEKKKSSLETFLPHEGHKHYAQGGFVGHIKESDTGGQADDIPKHIPEGSYVMNATDVSLLGDGSTDNGIKKLREFESKFARSGIHKPYDSHSRAISAKVSNDEYVMHPGTVTVLGNGSNQKGAKIIDKMRSNLRKQKGVAKILPPKTKDLHSYMKGGR